MQEILTLWNAPEQLGQSVQMASEALSQETYPRPKTQPNNFKNCVVSFPLRGGDHESLTTSSTTSRRTPTLGADVTGPTSDSDGAAC